MILAFLVILGLAMGSFVNALVYRLHEQSKHGKPKEKSNLSITKGRSICPYCKHRLAAADLVPIFSWLALRGKCRYCQKPISWQYPLVELVTAALFVASYFLWPVELEGFAPIFGFIFWLVALTGFIALAVYDFRYMLLPNKIIFPLAGLALINVLVQVLTGDLSLLDTLYALLAGGGIFYALFQISQGRWIGGGDVKLGFLIGLVLATPGLALFSLFAASLLGTIAVLPIMASGRLTPMSHIPFGPFMITGAVIAKLFGQNLIDWYLNVTVML